jgi:hypothetical protein
MRARPRFLGTAASAMNTAVMGAIAVAALGYFVDVFDTLLLDYLET